MKFQEKCLFPINWTKITFDDVCLAITQQWTISSRRNVDLSVEIKNMKLKLPFMWANMSTVLDHTTAKYLSLMWWIWILHQNTSIEDQVNQVNKVKRFWTPIVENPYILTPSATAREVMEIFEINTIWAIVIVDSPESKIVKWIITKRDLLARDFDEQKVSDLMTPIEELKYISSETLNIDINENISLLKKARVEQLPILNWSGKLTWLFTRKWVEFYKNFSNSSRDQKWRLLVGAAVWQNRNPLLRAQALIDAWIDLLVIDTAHAWNQTFIKVIKEIRSNFPQVLIAAWNVDNSKAAYDLIMAWADIIKIWIGPGWACKTREQTWFGTPQLSAVWEIREMIDEKWLSHIKLIADGGINKPWNLAKALAAGASFGMSGSILAWTDLAPWEVREINWRLYKDYRGMASSFEADIANKLSWKENDNQYWPIFDEWANDIVPYKWDGSFIKTLRLLHGGLASAFSYANANNIDEFYQNSRLQLQTINWHMEWRPWAFGK